MEQNGHKKMGRPRIEISQDTFEELCKIQCTLTEVASVLRCSEDTIERWCQRTYGATFAETYKKLSEDGKSSLRRTQFRIAQTNPAMAIWLGKQYLGQRDTMTFRVEDVDAEIERRLAELATGSQIAVAGAPESPSVH